MIDAEQLANELDDEFIQGRISNHNGRKAAALLRSQAFVIARMREAIKAHLEASNNDDTAGDTWAGLQAALKERNDLVS